MSSGVYLSELFRIVEGALRLDGVKVRNYASLLADKLAEDGDEGSAQRLRRLIDSRAVQLHPTRAEQHSPAPVDSESRFPLVERVTIDPSADLYIFTDGQKAFVEDYLSVVRSRADLESKGISAGTNLLLYGPPGCGKSCLAFYIARQLKLPLYVARLDGLISSFLGSTAKNIRSVFEFASRTPCVLLLDEFDAVAKLRDDQQELGELKRVVNSFIQNLDSLGAHITLIAATNHEQLLDPAVWRRFQYLLHIGAPPWEQREALWTRYSPQLLWGEKEIRALTDISEGFSMASIHAAANKLLQQSVTRTERPTIRSAFKALAQLVRGESIENTLLVPNILDQPELLYKQLRERNAQLYNLSLVAEIAGVSKATVSRIARGFREGKE